MTSYSTLEATLLQNHDGSGDTIPDNVIHNVNQRSPIPLFDTERKVAEDDTEVISIISQSDRGLFDHKSLSEYSRKVTDFSKFNHDFTFSNWSFNTDKKFSDSVISLDDGLNHYTPDMIIEHHGLACVSVVEFATMVSASEKSIQRTFNVKVSAYRHAILNRESKFPNISIKLFVIVVSPTMICHNIMGFQDRELNHLSFRLRCALELSISLRNLDIDVGSTRAELDERSRNCKIALGSLRKPISEINNPFFSKEWLDACEAPINPEYIQQQIKKCKKIAKETVERESFLSMKNYSYPDALVKNAEECLNATSDFVEEMSNFEKFKGSKMKSIVNMPFFVASRSMEASSKIKDSKFEWTNLYEASETPVLKLWREAQDSLRSGDIKRANEGDEMSEETFESVFGKELLLDLDVVSSAKTIGKDSTSKTNPETEDLKKIFRNEYHRFDARSLDISDRISLAKDGVQGKNFKDVEEIMEKAYDKRQVLNWNCDTSDLDRFFECCDNLSVEMEDLEYRHDFKLIDSALKTHIENPAQLTEPTLGLLRTAIGSQASMISDVSQELILSLRQGCKKDSFIIKKVRYYDIFMIIKPTKSTEHIFVSFLWYRNENNYKKLDKNMIGQNSSVFLRYYDCGDFCYSNFVSFKMHKLKNLVTAESSFVGICAYFSEFCRLPIIEQDYTKKTTGAFDLKSETLEKEKLNKTINYFWKLNLFTMLVLLHDKTPTEEAITMSRYIVMEGFVSFPKLPKPHKMLEKFNRKIRSRFELFIYKKLIETMKELSGRPFKLNSVNEGGSQHDNDDDLAVDDNTEYKNIFDPIFHVKLDNPHQLINLFYIGYYKNKDENPEKNSSFQLLKKILEWEDKLNPRSDFLGKKDPDIDEVKEHEYSRSFTTMLVRSARKKLKQQLGSNYKEKVEKDILEKLSSIDLENMATLKATSNFGPDLLASRDVKNYHRSKVIEKVTKNSHRGNYLFEHIESALRFLEGHGKGLFVDIFKKAQHGGIREIYVLSWESRIVQLVVETISRVLCSYFESETMTHPKNKFNLQKDHHMKSRILNKNNETITVATSDDAAKWNQGHFVTKFGQMLIGLVPEYMHSFIIRALALWTNKKIMISEDILRIIEKDFPPEIDQMYYSDMVKGHKGQAQVRWKKPGTSYVETSSGMMQGILHYTSSLWHTIYLDWLSKFIELDLKKLFSTKPMFKPIVTNMQSSDDSSVLISFTSTDHIQNLTILCYCAIIFEFKHVLGRLLGIYKSVKCTQNTIGVMEFNSEYFFASNLFRPTIRWVAAANILTEEESLGSRQEAMSNTLTSVLEGGGSLLTTALVQIGQALIHYRTFGSRLSSCFNQYSCRLEKLPDPSLGFFLMDNPFICGIAGFKYNLYIALKRTKLSLKYSMMIKNATSLDKAIQVKQIGKVITKELTTSGTMLQSTCVSFGNRKKWKDLIEKINLDIDYLSYINSSFGELLYRRAKTTEELRVKLAVKAHSPGVTTSLARGNDITRLIAAGVYILQDPITNVSSQWYNVGSAKIMRLRLANLICRDLSDYFDLSDENNVDLTEEDYNTIFPFRSSYDDLENFTRQFSLLHLYKTGQTRRKVKTDVEIIDSRRSTCIPIEEICRSKWYNLKDLPYPTRVIESDWSRFKKTYPWLHDDPEKTLEESPFENHVQLQNFLSRQDLKGRMIHLSASPVSSRHGYSNLHSLVNNDFFPEWTLIRSDNPVMSEDYKIVRFLKHQIYMLASSNKTDVEDLIIQSLIGTSDFSKSVKPNSRNEDLGVIQEVCKRICKMEETINKYQEISLRPENIMRMQLVDMHHSNSKFYYDIVKDYLELGRGVVGSFITRQKYDKKKMKYTGLAEWYGSINGSATLIRAGSTDDSSLSVVLEVTSSSRSAFFKNLPFFKVLLKELKLENNTNKPDELSLSRYKLVKEKSGFSNEKLLANKVVYNSEEGARLIFDKTKKFILNSSSIRRLNIEYSNGYLKLMGQFSEKFFKENYISPHEIKLSDEITDLKRRIEKEQSKLRKSKTNQSQTTISRGIRNLQSKVIDLESRLMETVKLTVLRFKLSANDLDKFIARDSEENWTSSDRSKIHNKLPVLMQNYVKWSKSTVDLESLSSRLESEIKDLDDKISCKSDTSTHQLLDLQVQSNKLKRDLEFLTVRVKDSLRSHGIRGMLSAEDIDIDEMEIDAMTEEQLEAYLMSQGMSDFGMSAGFDDFFSPQTSGDMLGVDLKEPTDIEDLDAPIDWAEEVERENMISNAAASMKELLFIPDPDVDMLDSSTELYELSGRSPYYDPKNYLIKSVFSHPFADDYIRNLITKVGFEPIRRLIHDRIVNAANLSRLHSLIFLLQINSDDLIIEYNDTQEGLTRINEDELLDNFL